MIVNENITKLSDSTIGLKWLMNSYSYGGLFMRIRISFLMITILIRFFTHHSQTLNY
jgi:hypothetical protein